MKKTIGNHLLHGVLAAVLSIICISAYAGEYKYDYNFFNPVISEGENGFNKVTLEGANNQIEKAGAPMLPYLSSKILIPNNEKVIGVSLIHSLSKTVDGAYDIQPASDAYPLSFNGAITNANTDPDIYDIDQFYPTISHNKNGESYLHGRKILTTDIFPIRFNPVTGKIVYYPSMTLVVKTEEIMAPALLSNSRNKISDKRALISVIDNKDAINNEPAYLMAAPLDNSRQFLIITTQDLSPAFQDYIDYRSSAAGGNFQVYLETVDNIYAQTSGSDNAEKIRNYIRTSYNNNGTEYVLLGGDADGDQSNHAVPSRFMSGAEDNIISDYYYACLDGPWNGDGDGFWGTIVDGTNGGDIDFYPEVAVGRIAADNQTELLTHLQKIIQFEQSSSGPTKVLQVGEYADDTPTWTGDKIDYLGSFMPMFEQDQIYDRDWAGNYWGKTDLTNMINTNQYFWLNHLGHADYNKVMKLMSPGFNYGPENDVDLFTNSDPFFLFTQGCYPGSLDSYREGSFMDDDSIVEEMTNGTDNGAFAIIANTRKGWYTPGNVSESLSNMLQANFIENVVSSGYNRIGDALNNSKAALPVGASSPNYQHYRYIAWETTLFGDPTTKLIADNLINKGEITSISANVSNGTITVNGSAYDADNNISQIEVMFDNNGIWKTASGTTNWTISIDSGSIDNQNSGSNIHSVQARTVDTNNINGKVSYPAIFEITDVFCASVEDTVSNHIDAGRAESGGTTGWWWYQQTKYITIGSGEDLGTDLNAVYKLKEQPEGYFSIGECQDQQYALPEIDSFDVEVNGTDVKFTIVASSEDTDITGVLIFYKNWFGYEMDKEGNTWVYHLSGIEPGNYDPVGAYVIDSRGQQSATVFSNSFSITTPVAPIFNDCNVESVSSNNLNVSCSISDPNEDISSVSIGGMVPEANCSFNHLGSGNYSANCNLDISNRPTGENIALLLAEDTGGLQGTTSVTFIKPDNSAPVFNSCSVISVTTSTLEVSCSITDTDNNLDTVGIGRMQVENGCSVTGNTNYTATCILDISTTPSGNNSAVIQAIDTESEAVYEYVEFVKPEDQNCFTAALSVHVDANPARAYSSTSWWTTNVYAVGSDELLGSISYWSDPVVSLLETGSGVWNKVDSCP